MNKIGKWIYPSLLILFALLWVGELTRRRAIELAGYYVNPVGDFLDSYAYSYFSIIGWRSSGKMTGPVWVIVYGRSTVEPVVYVSLFGNVKGSNFEPLDNVLGLSDQDRKRHLTEWQEKEMAKGR